jgi:hypothetical protein
MISKYPPDIWFTDNDYFTVNEAGEIIYTTGATGATSTNSTTVRSELRHLTNYSYNDTMEHTVLFSVESTSDKVIVHQLHGDVETFYMASMRLNASGKMLLRIFVDRAEDNSDLVAVTIRDNIDFGTKIKLRACYSPTEFKLYMDDIPVLTVDNLVPRIENTYCYWKCGAYGFSSVVKNYPILES